MATANSTVDAVLDYLVAAITTAVQALGQVPTPTIYDGPPADGPNMPDDMIVIGEQVDQTYTPHALVGNGGQYWLMESYTVSVVIDCYRGDNLWRLVRKQVTTLANAIDGAVRNDPSLGGTENVRAWPEQHRYVQEFEPNAKGVRARCEMLIRVESLN